jgi:hypothetical protein
MMLTLAGAQAKQFEHVSLGSAKDVSHSELRLPKFVRRRHACHNTSLCQRQAQWHEVSLFVGDTAHLLQAGRGEFKG